MHYLRQWLIVFFILQVTGIAHAKPFVPTSQDEIIKIFSISNEMKLINIKRKILLNDENNFYVLDEIINLYLKLGRENSDPRYFGYAQALLLPYLKRENLPEKILIHWADILQHRHDFNKSLIVLNDLANKNTNNPQVYLMRAIIYISRGEYEQALSNCKSLIVRASHLLSVSCVAQVKSLTGSLPESFELLQSTLKLNQHSDIEERTWALSLLADMAARSGDILQAENYYRQGLLLNKNDFYVLANYADLLLKQQQYRRVTELLNDYRYVDSLLLRWVIAGENNSKSSNQKYMTQLDSSYRLLELRGEQAHLRDQARFYFKLIKNYPKAINLAKQNWLIQKEPADAKLLLNIAIASNNKVQYRKIKAWFSMHLLEDVEISRALNKAVEL